MRTVKTSFLALAAVVALFITACGGGAPKPGDVTVNFLNAIQDLKFEDAKQYATAESAQLLDMLAGLANMSEEEAADQPKATFTVKEENIDGDNCTVVYVAKSPEGEEMEESIDLVKVDGQWKVKFDKESMGMGGGMEEPMMEEPMMDDMGMGDSVDMEMEMTEEPVAE